MPPVTKTPALSTPLPSVTASALTIPQAIRIIQTSPKARRRLNDPLLDPSRDFALMMRIGFRGSRSHRVVRERRGAGRMHKKLEEEKAAPRSFDRNAGRRGSLRSNADPPLLVISAAVGPL